MVVVAVVNLVKPRDLGTQFVDHRFLFATVY